jgi:hypothetical protein
MNCLFALGFVASAIASAGCSAFASHSCGLVAYICDQTTVTLQSPNDAWTAGTYSLAVTMDGTSAQCSVQMPDPPAAGGVQGNCGSNTNLTLALTTVDTVHPIVCGDDRGKARRFDRGRADRWCRGVTELQSAA